MYLSMKSKYWRIVDICIGFLWEDGRVVYMALPIRRDGGREGGAVVIHRDAQDVAILQHAMPACADNDHRASVVKPPRATQHVLHTSKQ